MTSYDSKMKVEQESSDNNQMWKFRDENETELRLGDTEKVLDFKE